MTLAGTCSRGRVVKATDKKSVGIFRAGSNPADYDLKTEVSGGSCFQNNYLQSFSKKIL